jgi:hypothetical protein
MIYLKKFENFNLVSENLQYHINNNLSILENIFRPGSDSYFKVLKEARDLYTEGKIYFTDLDKELFENTDIGIFGEFNGKMVALDMPFEEELIVEKEEKAHPKLNKPTRSSGPKKYQVYVKNPKTGNIKKINFGDVKGGLTTKIDNPAARKSFAARHKCSTKKDKMKAGYWACRIPKYKNLYSGSYSGYW